MGYYLEFAEHNKAHALSQHKGVREVELEEASKYIPNVVCCVYNPGGGFWAAAWAFNEDEFIDFADPSDRRPKRWFIVPDEILSRNWPAEFAAAKKGDQNVRQVD